MAFPSSLTICDLYTCKADEITARVKAEMQDLEHPGLPAPEPGTRLVHNGENYAVTSISPDGVVIMREDEEGNYSLPEVISTDTYYAEKQAEIDAQEQEQQPQSGERGEAAQEIASPAEEEPAPVTGGGAVQEETAPGRMPKDEQGQPLYEQADAETAWDALLEQAGGDEAMAQEVANDIVSEQEKALKAAERELKKVQDGKPQQRKGDTPLTVEARIAAKQAVREQTSRAQAGVDEARKRLEAWRKIAETPQRRRRAIEAERRQTEKESQEAMQKLKDEVVDNQGNPIGENGRLIVEKVNSIEELTDEDFTNPTRSVELPQLPEAVSDAIGANGKPVVIKKNIFEKNKKTHRDLSAQDSRGIIKAALYSPQLYGQNKKTSRPFNWILIHLADKHSSIVIEVNNNKDNYEIVGWHYLDEEALQQKRNQAVREGGLILTIPQIGSAAGNAPENSKASGSKGSEKSEAVQENSQLSQIEQDASDFPFTYMGQQYVVRPIKTDDKGRYTDWFNGKTVRVDNAPEEATMAVFSPNGIVFEGYAARDNASGEYKLWYKDGKLLDKVPGTEAVREQTSRAQAERRQEEEEAGDVNFAREDTVGGSPVALSYLLENGKGGIESSGYFLHGVAAAFPELTGEIESIRSKYLSEIDPSPTGYVSSGHSSISEIRDLINGVYGEKGVSVFDRLLQNADGFVPKDGKALEKEIEDLRPLPMRGGQSLSDEAERIRREALNGVPDFIEDRPQDARARGYRRVNGNRVDRQQPIQARRGGEVQVKFDDNNIPTGHAALIEASQLQPSHTDGRRNPQHFIDEAQPKERNDEASVMSARKIAANIRPEEITSSVTAYTGAFTVNSRGEVIQGNNRSAALREMWAEHPEQAAKYRQYLADHAADFGLTPEDVEAMRQPVLVNMLDVTDDAAITLGQFVAQDTESGGTERIKPKNMVRKMGDDMRGFANRLLASADEEMSFAELVDRNGADVLKWMQQKGYITPTQYKSAFDSKGNLTAEAKNDLKGVMYQSIFQNGSSHLEEMFNALPAKAQKAILATAYRDYDSPNTERMIEEIQNSISAYHALSQDPAFAGAGNYKEARIAAEAWKRQYAFDDATGESYLPSERYSNFALLLATMYKGQTQTFIQNTLGHIYDLVQGTQEADLFNQPDNTPRTLVQAINETLGNLREELLLNENFTYNGQRRSNVLAGGSASGQRGRQGSDGNAPSGGRAEGGAGTATDKGRTVPNDTERGGQGDIRHSSGRQPDGLEASEEEVRLSDEIDENGRQFVLTSNGQLSFGEITEESGLTPAPILLSEGIITNPATNDGYGLVHIEARHGDQIRKAGYKSVIEFIEDVAQNYERVKEGNIRNGNPTYLIQLKDKHNNTLIVELSSDGNYWNINTAGIFKESYGKNRREIYNRHTTAKQSAETVGASQEAEQSGTTTSSSMNAPTSNIVSETPVKTEPQQPNNAVSTGSSLSENEEGGITSSEPNGKPTVSGSKDKKTSAETSQERQKTDSNLSEAFKQQMNIRIGQLSKFIKTKDGKLKKKYESLRKTPFFAIFDSGNIYEGPVAIAKTPREALNVAFNYDIGDFEVLYVDFRTKSLDMDLLSIYDVSGFRGDVYDENGAYKDEAKNLLVERISRLGKGNSTDVQGVEDFQQRESGADALLGNADENIRRAESEVERNPTEAQKEAGNYRKGHVRVDGLDVTIENPKGSVRSGTDADGKRWENVMNNTYGYMRGTEGVDGDHIDVFLSDNPESGNVYVVDQRDPKTGEFDEHKVMYGFGSMEEARDAYLKNYTPGWQGLGTITEVSKDEFRKWIGSSKRKTKPFAEYKSVKKEAGQNEDVRQSRDGSNPLSAEEAAIRDAIVERLRESGIEVITDVEAGQKVLDVANGRGEPVRTQAMLDGLAKAASTIRGWIKGNRRGRVFTIDLPESTQRKIKEAMGRDFDSHNITANGIAHALKNHGVGGYKLNERSIPLREEDMELIPYIMTAPDYVKKASTDVSGRESVRFYKNLSNGYVVVVEKEYKNSPDDMETITMWAELSSGATNARQNAVPDTHVLNAIPSTDSAKIRKDAEDAIHGDEKVREHRVYHGSGADFEAFDHSHMGEGEGAQAYGWGSYVTEVECIGRTYAKASTENKRENATVYKRRQIRDNEISINVIRGMIAEYPEQHREREKRLSDLEKELADQNSQKGRIEKESGKDSVAYRNFMFYAEDIIKDLERNIERTKRSIEDEAGYNEQRKRQVEELVAENARLQSEIDAIEAQYPRHLYTVEIPDDTGKNYLEWEKPVTKEQQGKIYKQLRDEKMTIKGASQSFWNGKSSEWQSGQKLIDFLIENFGSDKAASEFLSRVGFTGISYPAQATTGGRKDGARNYVIFDEKDLQITDHVRFFRTPGGEAYGFTAGGKIYIDPRTATADTPIHEYAHLWAGALRQANPKEWNNIVELMRDTPAWDEVKRLYPELESDEEIADEALAMYSGRRGAERLREAAEHAWNESADLGVKAAAARAMGRVRDALRRFWQNVADLLHFRYTSAEEVADRVMRDLMEGVNPNSRAELSAEERAIEEKAKKDGTWMKAPNGKPTNLTEKQWVQVRTRAFKQWFGDWEKAARIEKLRNSKPITIEYNEEYELNRASAKEWLKKNVRGEYTNSDTGEKIVISKTGINEVTSHGSQDEVHLKSLAVIPQMIEEAVFIDEIPNTKDHDKYDSYRYYVCGLNLDGEDYTAKIVVGVKGDSKYYDHRLTQIEKGTLIDNLNGLSNSVAENQNASVSIGKDSKLVSILQTNSSKVVDENGEPLVVYHGSDYRPLNGNGILIPNNGAMGKAVYFSSAFPEAADYAREKLGDMSLSEDEVYDNGYITEVFVNVRDEEDIAPSSYGNGEIIVAVRESNQIKSATDNTGAFSAGNDDIRYRMAEEEDRSLVAVHNISEDNLKKALELGGFPMPSIAVTKADVVKQAELKVGNYAENDASIGQVAESKGNVKAERIRKLRESKPVEITGNEIEPSDDLKQYKKNALEYGKNLQGSYTNKDTGITIQLQRGRRNGGINEVLQHDYKDVEHLQSIAAIPQIIENSIYIDSRENMDTDKNPDVKEYQYYVCGLKIGNVDYTVRSTVAVDKNGNRYYDHKLTHIEKGKLLDLINSQAAYDNGFGTTPGTKPTTEMFSNYKDTKLLSILQTDEEENEDELMYRDGGADEDGTRDTPLSSPTVHAWDRLAQSLKFQLRETTVDYLTAIDKFQDLIAKHSGRKIESFENAYDWMTFLTSRNRVEMDMFDSSVVRPLNNAILKLIKNGGTKQPIIFP